MMGSDKPLKAADNLKRLLIPLVIGWVKIMCKHIPEEMVSKSFVRCGLSNKVDGTKDNAIFKHFLDEDVAETCDVFENDNLADYYDDSPATVLRKNVSNFMSCVNVVYIGKNAEKQDKYKR